MKFWAALFYLFAVLAALPAQAADAPAEQRIVHAMTVIDPVTLLSDNTRITLWGVMPVQTVTMPFTLKAQDLLP